MQVIGNDENFAIPYWESKTQCEPAICSEELLSVTSQADGTRRANTLTTGTSNCSSEETNSRTKMYHQTNRKSGLERITK